MGSWTSPNPQTPGLDPDPDPDPNPNPGQAQARPHPQPQPRAQPKQVESFDVGAGDYVLCFSDGVSGNLALNEIARLVSACEGQSAEVAACVDIHICIRTHMPYARHGTRMPCTADGPNPDTDSNPDPNQVVARTIVAAAKNAKLIADDVTAVAVR